ncbi:MAG: SDR family oxidoreductase [candidate division NC10 bacterium]|nr:SDR family oxidoreductase [candidate division NC10 bacterium]
MRLQGKVAVITGGGRGIGRTVALAYANEGASVAICARSASELHEAEAAIAKGGGQVLSVVCDVTRVEPVEGFVKKTLEAFGRIDILVNNAGVLTRRAPLKDVTIEDWDYVMAVNLRGPFLMTRAVLPHMLKKRQGGIINVSSGLGRMSLPGWGPYGVSKWGLEGFTRYLADELEGSGIQVNVVSPGMVRTKMTNFSGAPVETVIDLFVFLASDLSRRITGRSLDVGTWRSAVGLRG